MPTVSTRNAGLNDIEAWLASRQKLSLAQHEHIHNVWSPAASHILWKSHRIFACLEWLSKLSSLVAAAVD